MLQCGEGKFEPFLPAGDVGRVGLFFAEPVRRSVHTDFLFADAPVSAASVGVYARKGAGVAGRRAEKMHGASHQRTAGGREEDWC